MPRYFFHVHDGKQIPDTQGVDLPGVAEARDQAIAAAGEMIRSDGHTVWNGSDWRLGRDRRHWEPCVHAPLFC